MHYTVLFEPWGTTAEVAEGQTLLEAARQAEIPVGAVCSGRGTCGKCQVRVVGGPPLPILPAEEEALTQAALDRGLRLACLHAVSGNVTVEILPIVVRGKEEITAAMRAHEHAPAVERYGVEVHPPALDHPVDDAANISEALADTYGVEASRVDYALAHELSRVLRGANWDVTASVCEGEVISVHPADRDVPPLGLAIDLGTTNIAAYLYSLTDGTLLGVFGAGNPLAAYGADIISRLSYVDANASRGRALQSMLLKTINLLIEHAVGINGWLPTDIEAAAVVGNTGMHHLLLGLPASQLIRAPYVPVFRHKMVLKARDLGLAIAPGASVYVPPLIGGFVGSDLLAVALATRLDRLPGVHMAIDIGTNTELLLSIDGQLYSASTASGPALEGAALRFGCMAIPGAVDRAWVDEQSGTVRYHTIKNRPAVGICGSGIIDTLAAMVRLGAVSHTGRMQAGHPLVRAQEDGDHWFVLAPAEATGLGEDLTVTQHDVRAIQLAKGAIRAGIEVLLGEQGLAAANLSEFLIAGAFGTHISVESAMAIGLFPDLPRDRVRQIGNAAGTGAALMMLSIPETRAGEMLARRIRYVELAGNRRFTRLFADSQRFP